MEDDLKKTDRQPKQTQKNGRRPPTKNRRQPKKKEQC